MAAVAWRRGFFRVWIVLAVLWAILMIIIQSGSILNPYVPGKVVATLVGDTVQLYDIYSPQERAFQQGVEAGALVSTKLPGRDFALITRKDTEPATLQERIAEAEQVVAQYVETETSRRRTEAILPLAMLSIVPPLIVLALGAAIAWAISGFRRTA